jgi:hypothetical protein
MALGLAEGAAHAAVEGFDGGVENATRGVEVARAKRVGVTRQACARKSQGLGSDCALERGGDVMGLERLVVAVAAG